MGNKELLVLILKLAQAQKKEQKAQALVGYLTREILRCMGKMEKCDPENMLKMQECYEKGLLPDAKTFEQMVDELKNWENKKNNGKRTQGKND